MSSTTLKVLALVTLLLAVVLGFMAYRMSQNMTNTAAAPPSEAASQADAQTLAVVAVKPIRAHEAITARHIERVPVSVLPGQYFESADEVVDRYPLVDIEIGTTLTPRLFKGSNLLSKTIPPGHRAMSLEIDDVIAVGGFVQPGDVVDALLYIRSKSKEVDDSQARLLLEETTVLAYEEQLLPEPEDAGDMQANGGQQTRQRRQRTVVLAVPEAETVRVMLGASIGDIRLALHGQTRAETESTSGATVEDIKVVSADEESAGKDQEAGETAKPITLRELSAIKRKRSKRAYTPPPVYVYRGNEVQTVRH